MPGPSPSDQSVEINGEQPPILGLPCQNLVAIEFWHAGSVVEPANVVFLQFADCWHRLYFDYGIIFWRTEDVGPQSFVSDESDDSFRAVDLATPRGLHGQRLRAIRYAAVPGGSEAALEFDAGLVLTFRCINDITTYA